MDSRAGFLWSFTLGAMSGFGWFQPAARLAGRRGNMKKECDFTKGRRGPVLKPLPGKTRVTIPLDDVASRLSPVEACTCNVNSLLVSPERARVPSVPENVAAVVPHVPLLHTATNESPAAPVWTDNSANPMPCDASEPREERLAA